MVVLKFFMLIALIAVFGQSYGRKQCTQKIDILVMMDVVEMKAEDFTKTKTFTENVLKQFKIGKDDARLALLLYGGHAYDWFCFNEYSDAQNLDQLFAHKCEGCDTKTRKLKLALEHVKSDTLTPSCGWRGGAAKTVVLIFVAGPGMDGDVKAAADAIKAVPKSKIIAIGVGSKVNHTELDTIGNTVFMIKNITSLDPMIDNTMNLVCTPPCPDPLDVLIILDASGSVTKTQFEQAKTFLKQMVGGFNVGENAARFSMMIYAQFSKKVFCFKDYKTQNAVQAAIGRVTRKDVGFTTYTATALKFGRQTIFTTACGARPNARNIVIFATDGFSSVQDKSVLRLEAQYLKDSVKAVMAIGIGNYHKEELTKIASGTDMVFTTKSFDGLSQIESSLTKKTCEKAKEAPNKCQEKIDLLVIMDASGSIADKQFDHSKDFVAKMVSEFKIGTDNVQVAMIVYHKNAHKIFCFNEHKDATTLIQAIKAQSCPSPCLFWKTMTSKALNKGVTDIFVGTCGIRAGAKKVTIILTDGQASESLEVVKKAADSLREKSPIVSIGIGAVLNNAEGKAELAAIASSTTGANPRKLLFETKEFGNLPFVEKWIAASACRAKIEPK